MVQIMVWATAMMAFLWPVRGTRLWDCSRKALLVRTAALAASHSRERMVWFLLARFATLACASPLVIAGAQGPPGLERGGITADAEVRADCSQDYGGRDRIDARHRVEKWPGLGRGRHGVAPRGFPGGQCGFEQEEMPCDLLPHQALAR